MTGRKGAGDERRAGHSADIDALAPVLDAGVIRVMTVNEPNIVAVFPRLGPEGLGIQAEPGAEADTEAYCEPRDQVFMRATAGDDYIGVQTYTRGRIGPGGDPVDDPAVPRTLTGWEYYPQALGGAVRRVTRILPGAPSLTALARRPRLQATLTNQMA
jgi:beta-glucosidase